MESSARHRARLAPGLRGEQHGAAARLDRGGSGDRSALAHHGSTVSADHRSGSALAAIAEVPDQHVPAAGPPKRNRVRARPPYPAGISIPGVSRRPPRKRRACAPKGRRIRPVGRLSEGASSGRRPCAPGTSGGNGRWPDRKYWGTPWFRPFPFRPYSGPSRSDPPEPGAHPTRTGIPMRPLGRMMVALLAIMPIALALAGNSEHADKRMAVVMGNAGYQNEERQ